MANDYGVTGSPNSNVPHPDGLDSYGYIPSLNSKGASIPAGRIFLRNGRHTGPNRGFGIRHIWAEHSKELQQSGYQTINDVAKYIRDIIQPGASIYCEFSHPGGRHRPTVLKTALGIVILEPREDSGSDSGYIYVVVTAYKARKAHGVMLGSIK